MSKSLGTGINPLDLIDRYGADGTRYGLLKMSSTQDVRFAEGSLDEGAKLANKLWNASRFVLLQADAGGRAGAAGGDGRGPLDPVAAGRHRRGAAGRARGIRLLGGGQGALRVRLERLLRLVRGGRQVAAVRRRRRRPQPGVGDAAVGAGADGGAGAPDTAVRDRGDLGIPAGGARPAVDLADARARRRPARPRAGGGAPSWTWRWSARRGGSPTRGSGRWRRCAPGVPVPRAARPGEGRPGAGGRLAGGVQRGRVAPTARRSIGGWRTRAPSFSGRRRSSPTSGSSAGAPEQVVAAERDKAERYAAEVAELERRLSEQ